MKLTINQSLMAQGLYQSQLISTIFDGMARQAVKESDESFGDPVLNEVARAAGPRRPYRQMLL
jgi:hypothetical protein